MPPANGIISPNERTAHIGSYSIQYRYIILGIAWFEILVMSGEGDVIEPDSDVIGIGSGGGYASAAARALLKHTELPATEIARASMEIAADLCIYTNNNISIVSLQE